MTDNSNENIKEIFVEMIKEVDEISLKSYINSLSRYSQDYNREFKENKFPIEKLIDLKFVELKNDLTEKISNLKSTLQESINKIELRLPKIITPTIISPLNAATNQSSSTTVTISAFQTQGASDTLKQTTWEIATDAGFSQNRYSYKNTGSSYTFKGLQPSQTYYWRAKYSGYTNGDSEWVGGSFSTKFSFDGLVGIAGEKGFGVCECPDIDRLKWIKAMPGSSDKSSENYGNYQTLNGSVMCCIPKFFYRWGHKDSPNYAKYGANALDIVGADVFSSESESQRRRLCVTSCVYRQWSRATLFLYRQIFMLQRWQ